MWQIISWLDDYTDGIQAFLVSHVVLAPLLLLIVEESGIPLPVPGDAIIAYVGYGLSKTDSATMWQAFVIANLSVLIGASILFFLSRRWGQSVIRRIARFIFLRQSHVDRAERIFAKYGVWAVIFGRHIPGLRIPTTVIAASAGMSYITFMLSTVLSTFAWVFLYLEIGSRFGGDFVNLFRRDIALTISGLLVLTVIALGLHAYGYLRAKDQAKRTKNRQIRM
jgi:membrane protein DedA with SNARE-associated domain